MKYLSFVVVILSLLIISMPAHAQQAIQCGEIIQDQFSKNEEMRQYAINADVGDAFNLSAKAFGSSLEFAIIVQDPVGNVIFKTPSASSDPTLNTDVLGAQGNYFITLFNGEWTNGSLLGNGGDSGSDFYTDGQGIGAFTLNVGCTLANGKIVKPGDLSNAPTSIGSDNSGTPTTPAFSGNGFPGLDPKDFSDGVLIPLTIGAGNSGSITPNFDSVFGYTFDGKAGQVFDLNFTRTSGNLNLGLAVLSADNKIVFQASLVTSSDLSTHFTLPSDGTYTIGVYKIDLLPPDSPRTTAFQITGTLSSS